MTRAQEIIDLLLVRDWQRAESPVLGEWLPVWRSEQATLAGSDAFVAATAAALRCDRLAWAFFSGYQGALQSAFPGAVRYGSIGAFCVHESGRKISEICTLLDHRGGTLLLQGSKSWVLAGLDELTLLVLARLRSGPSKGPGSLAVVQLPLRSAGASLGTSRPQSVVPELPHAEGHFNAVSLQDSQLLPGDGYSDHAKPFRLREDVFVTGCALSYLLAEARLASWPTSWCQRCVAAIAGLHSCSELAPADARTHILAAGALSIAGDVIRESEHLWQEHQCAAHARWRRDRSLLAIGKDARRQRAIGSWSSIGWETERA